MNIFFFVLHFVSCLFIQTSTGKYLDYTTKLEINSKRGNFIIKDGKLFLEDNNPLCIKKEGIVSCKESFTNWSILLIENNLYKIKYKSKILKIKKCLTFNEINNNIFVERCTDTPYQLFIIKNNKYDKEYEIIDYIKKRFINSREVYEIYKEIENNTN